MPAKSCSAPNQRAYAIAKFENVILDPLFSIFDLEKFVSASDEQRLQAVIERDIFTRRLFRLRQKIDQPKCTRWSEPRDSTSAAKSLVVSA